MLGCIQPMSSPMMKRMLGLPAGACADAGMFVAGRLIAAKATLETSRLPNLLPIFMTPDPPLRIVVKPHFPDDTEERRQSVLFPSCYRRDLSPPYRPVDFQPPALRALCDFGRNVLVNS